jgi:hypothetical protein
MAARDRNRRDRCCYGHRSPRWIDEADASAIYEAERARSAIVAR